MTLPDGSGRLVASTPLESDSPRRARTGWLFWLKWSLATLVGLVASAFAFVAAGVVAGEAMERLPGPWDGLGFGLTLGVILGIGLGLAQWVVLRSRLRRAFTWIGATVAGFVAGTAIIFGFMDGSNPGTSLVVKLGHAVVLGGALGIAQWLVLRRKLDAAYLWIFVSLFAWLTAELVGVALTALVGPPLDLLGLFLAGAVLPGAGMAWLLRASNTRIDGIDE